MPDYDPKRKIVDLPLFRQPDLHQTIWESLSKPQLAQLVKLMSRIWVDYQKLQGGCDNE